MVVGGARSGWVWGGGGVAGALALAAACMGACDGAPAVSDAGADAQDEPPMLDAAGEAGSGDGAADGAADALADADAGVPCGITAVWSDLPQHLDCTGLYTDLQNKIADPSAHPYAPGVELWSDGATKQRYLYLPPNSTIDTSDMDEWTFPVGTKVWKEFSISGARIETRLFYKSGSSSWLWTTYVWNQGETDAVRLDTGATNVVGTYEIPDKVACDQCHGGRQDRLMGVEAVALSLPTAQGATLDWLATNGKLSAAPTNTTATLPEDSTGKAGPALGFLHINCGVACHNRNPAANGNSSGMFTRLPAAEVLAGTAVVTNLDTYTTAANVTPISGTYSAYANQGYKRILPGSSGMSLVVTVAGERGAGQMPPIISHEVPTAQVALLQGWIDALP